MSLDSNSKLEVVIWASGLMLIPRSTPAIRRIKSLRLGTLRAMTPQALAFLNEVTLQKTVSDFVAVTPQDKLRQVFGVLFSDASDVVP